jgi:DNA-binding MarR family transcriptional regulator
MTTDDVATVRRFNRTVTERIGALDDDYLRRGRPLGASRLLWEIPPDGADTRSLRRRLALDSGYLSRLLRMLERAGLVTTGRHLDDGRVRTVRLTAAGRDERAALDAESDALAKSMLAPLDDARRAALVEAMATVERLLTAAAVELSIEPADSADAAYCLSTYYAELDARFDDGFDTSQAWPADPAEMTEPHGVLLVGRLHGEPVACGALKLDGQAAAEIKRLWVAPHARGLGLGGRVLRELEQLAAARGVRTVRLDTNRNLSEAIAMYRGAGYREIDRFNDEPYAHHWFEKRLTR